MRCLVVADLHYSLPQFDWLLAAAPEFDVVIFAGDALDIGFGDPLVQLQSPMSATLLGIALDALLAPFVMKGMNRFKANED